MIFSTKQTAHGSTTGQAAKRGLHTMGPKIRQGEKSLLDVPSPATTGPGANLYSG
jgi:hypothetical protein